MIRRFALSAILSALTVSYTPQIAANTGGAHTWESYRERSSGVFVNFPRDLFVVDAGRSLVGTGHVYSTHDGRAFMAVFSVPIQRDGGNPVEDWYATAS